MHPLLKRLLSRAALGASALALLTGLAAVPTAEAVVTSAQPWVTGNPTFKAPSARPAQLGVVYQGTWNLLTTAQRGKVLDDLAAAGVGWVVMDLGWTSLQPTSASAYSMGDVAEWDRQIGEVRARGLKVLALFQHAPKWASGTSNRNGRPKDPNQYATAAAWVAKRYDGKTVPGLQIDAMQLWNEPNLEGYWASSPTASRVSSFAALIKAAGPAVKKANPNITVVAGGVSAVDVAWFTEFYKTAGVIGTYDAVGIHPYQSPGDATPETYDAKWGMYYMRHITALDSLMASKKDAAKIWATEFGWSAHANKSSPAARARGVTEAQQADYLLRSMSVFASVPRVQAAFWYSSITTSTGDVQFDNYGLLRQDLSRRPVYYALKCAASKICGPTTTKDSVAEAPTTGTLLPAGSTWSYNSAGTDLGTAWRTETYDSSKWSTGAAQLGYGDGDEKTAIPSGSSSSRPMTSYFRRTFSVSSASGVAQLRLKAIVDDGAAVYLNGTEIWRNNLPSGTLSYGTKASAYVAGSAESAWNTVDLPATALKTGTNTIAVEVHQDSATSSDLSFDLSLEAR